MRFWPLVFLLGAWGFVLGLTVWCFYRLLTIPHPEHEKLPPPGTSL